MALSRDFRFGALTRASHASPALNATNLPPERTSARSTVFRRLVFAHLTSPACCRATDFSDTTLVSRLLGNCPETAIWETRIPLRYLGQTQYQFDPYFHDLK